MDAEEYSNEVLERTDRQTKDSFDLKDLERLCAPLYDALGRTIWDYTLVHSKPATEE